MMNLVIALAVFEAICIVAYVAIIVTAKEGSDI